MIFFGYLFVYILYLKVSMFTKCSDCLLRIIGLTSIRKRLISEPYIADILVGAGVGVGVGAAPGY